MALRRCGEQEGQFHISHDPGDSEASDLVEAAWLELLVDGLTFDCLGLEPGPALRLAEPRHRFEFTHDIEAGSEAIAIVPGPHLAGAGNSLPVVRTMVRLAAELAYNSSDLLGVFWQPAQSVIGKSYFTSIASQWLSGGAFPALGLSGIVAQADGALRSDGLAFFTGQEIEIEASLASNKVKASQLIVRLVDVLAGSEPLKESQEIMGIDGRPLVLTPSSDGSIVRVFAQ
jgi:hypothetical protein